mgnify:CR=1 FL=1
MKKTWNKVKVFWQNIKKLYKLSQMVTFDDSDNTIIFDGNLESIQEVRSGSNVLAYYDRERKREEARKLLQKVLES